MTVEAEMLVTVCDDGALERRDLPRGGSRFKGDRDRLVFVMEDCRCRTARQAGIIAHVFSCLVTAESSICLERGIFMIWSLPHPFIRSGY